MHRKAGCYGNSIKSIHPSKFIWRILSSAVTYKKMYVFECSMCALYAPLRIVSFFFLLILQELSFLIWSSSSVYRKQWHKIISKLIRTTTYPVLFTLTVNRFQWLLTWLTMMELISCQCRSWDTIFIWRISY